MCKILGEEEALYWEKVAKIVAAKKERKMNQRHERKKEKRRAYNAQKAAAYVGEEEEVIPEQGVSFDSLLEQKHAEQREDQNTIVIDPNLRSKRKKKRDNKSGSRFVRLLFIPNHLIYCWHLSVSGFQVNTFTSTTTVMSLRERKKPQTVART